MRLCKRNRKILKTALKVKDRKQEHKTYIKKKQQNFVFTAQFPSRCDQTSRSDRNIGKNPQDCFENRQGMPLNMPLSTRSRNDF